MKNPILDDDEDDNENFLKSKILNVRKQSKQKEEIIKAASILGRSHSREKTLLIR